MRFKKLRISGFKSFVEPADFVIEKGLTGIVGPNGCGKSNLIEALRWAMGETSAKQMRGDEMDDVIFGGTTDRPQRNIAEVILSLDNSERTAPAQFNDFNELDISRRIERGSGSTYRVNGKEVRSRDVQLLFADAATGARSTAIVSQGRIGAVIAAKPAERRKILEEAAGITGLHSRRHEAELRLRGAETNMERLDDILSTLEAQLQNLKKQSRQASRYRNLSGHIRKAEASLYYLRWTAAAAELEAGRERFKAAEAEVVERTRQVAAATVRHEECSAATPELRRAEAEAASRLQRLTLAREALDAEEQRIGEARRDCRLRLEQAATDSDRETVLSADADAAVKNMEAERAAIEDAQQGELTAGEESAAALAVANEAVNSLEAALAEITGQAATDEARRAGLETSIRELRERTQRLADRAAGIAGQRIRLEAEGNDIAALSDAVAHLAEAHSGLEQARAGVVKAEAVRVEAADSAARAVSTLHAAQSVMTRLAAEEQALAEVLEAGDSAWPPLIDAVTVDSGLETALGVALGEDLSAPVDEPASVHWRTMAPFASPPALPVGAEPLADFVKAPSALARRLSQIGVVGSHEEGVRLAKTLVQGQRLVSRDGGLWRWDGLTVAAGAATASAARLQQRNRLRDVRSKLDAARADAAKAEAGYAEAGAIGDRAARSEKEAREAAAAADAAFTLARDRQAWLKEKMTEHASRMATLEQTAAGVKADLEETETHSGEAAAALAVLPDPGIARDRIAGIRVELAENRAVQLERQSAYDNLVRVAGQRRQRLGDIDRELESWRLRREGAALRLGQLAERRRTINDELERISTRPAEIVEQRNALFAGIEEAEENRRRAADRLAEAENLLSGALQSLRAFEVDLAASREQRVRAEGEVERGGQAVEGLVERIAEKLDCSPGELAEIAGLAEGAEPPGVEEVEIRLDRLQRERETMGPVNLRAEQETNELSEQIETLTSERGDLTGAVAKLRQGIAELNREGRQRLLASFAEVDRHFQELFSRLFGGGHAHLTLTESDDPLEAGLEIMASPPGKRLQVLSLLSGGEQALTALSLLFGVFLTNPAPVCVLDEVDAPLDDANVDRFCSMLTEMAASGRTRFMVVTHHHMTMARMDRLFGVTMAERGVSQLVSVDLHQAEKLRATA